MNDLTDIALEVDELQTALDVAEQEIHRQQELVEELMTTVHQVVQMLTEVIELVRR